MDRNETVTKHYLENYDNLVRVYTFRRHGSEADAEDIIQEAYYRALKYFDTYQPEVYAFSTWFGRIVYNCEKDFNKAFLRHGMGEDVDEVYIEPIIEDHVEVQDVASIRRMIYRQPVMHRVILLLYYVYQYSLSEIDSLYPSFGYKRVDNTVKEFRLRAIREKKL